MGLDWMEPYTTTGVTPRASLQSDANKNLKSCLNIIKQTRKAQTDAMVVSLQAGVLSYHLKVLGEGA